jgi:hypothetical protein
MIAEGDSIAALRYGSSEDASGSGVIVERGIGLTDIGLIDQHFTRRHRLGRLLMACVEQRQQLGFGIGEGSGLRLYGNGELEAIGAEGVVVLAIDPAAVRLAPGNPDPSGIQISVLPPGERFAVGALAQGSLPSVAGRHLLEEALTAFADDYRAAASASGLAFDAERWQSTLSA